MKEFHAAIASASLVIGQPVSAQDVVLAENNGPVAERQIAVEPAKAPVLIPRDTPVHLMVVNEVSSKDRRAGDRFKLRVTEPVNIGDLPVIPVGAIAWGEVTSSESSGNIGKSGKLEVSLLYVDTGKFRIPISGRTSDKGKSGTAETVMGVLALGLLGLFAKGNNAKIKAGELMTAFTSDDMTVAADQLS